MPIPMIVTIRTWRRPTLSPMRPKMSPPIGRAARPTPKVAKDAIAAAVAILAGEVLNVEDKCRCGTEEEEVVPFERGAQEGSDRNLVGVLDAEFMGGGVFRRSCGVVVAHVSLHRVQDWVFQPVT